MKSLTSMSPFMKRVSLGKFLGFLFGLSACGSLIYFTNIEARFAFGMFLWYMMTGVVIGAFGVMNKHPILDFKMNWIFRGVFFGGFMFLILALVGYNSIEGMLASYGTWFESPYWIIADGVFFGLLTDYLATKWFGEGKKLFK